MLKFLLERSLLDSTLFQSDTIITSHGIQKRFQEAVRVRASKTPVEVDGNIWLLKEDETQPFIKVTPKPNYSEKNPDYSEKNPDYSENNDTKESKVNESKINESIVNESMKDVSSELSAAAPEPPAISLPLNVCLKMMSKHGIIKYMVCGGVAKAISLFAINKQITNR